jgi:hypothetical protein
MSLKVKWKNKELSLSYVILCTIDPTFTGLGEILKLRCEKSQILSRLTTVRPTSPNKLVFV